MRLRHSIIFGTLLLLLIGFMTRTNFAQSQESPNITNQEPTSVLFENVQIFDGTSEQLSEPSNVLVVGNQIQTISTASISAPTDGSVTRINGEGRVLMPGLIDAHVHLFMETSTVSELEAGVDSPELLFRKAEENATAMLMRGFTSARDVAGPVFRLKRSIDQGDVVGPRIWPSGAMISQTSGHGDMPGLIDAHVHLFMETSTVSELEAGVDSPELLFRKAEENATAMLMRGFTSARDVAGPVFRLKRSIDQGDVVGPRIWPSGAMISQTSGHGDFRQLSELPRTPTSPLSPAEEIGIGVIADGVPEVLRRAREQLMQGASQIKLAAGGGVASDHDPLDVSEYTEDELRAAVNAAENWNTYVAVHVYTDRGIQTALRAGVKSIEHGQLMSEETAQMIAEKGAWLSTQPFLDDEDRNPYPDGSPNRARQLLVSAGTDNAYELAKKYNIKTAWGTDNLYSAQGAARQGAKLAKMVRWYTPAEVLRMATSTNAELLAMSGARNPYPGKLGVVEEGALADLLLVNGNPLENIQLIADPANNFVVIMKDGKIYKNLLG